MKNSVQAVQEMLVELSGFAHVSAIERSMYIAGGFMFSTEVCAQRNGPQIWAKLFHASSPNSQKLTAMMAAATLYCMWPKRCADLFASTVESFWGPKSSAKMLKVVGKAIESGAPVHPAVTQLAANVQNRIAALPKPIDMHIDDIKHPLKMAIRKGASREDLIRLVDEAIAESVMHG